MTRPVAFGAVLILVAVVAGAAGCTTTQGTPVAAQSVTGASAATASGTTTSTTTTSTATTSASPPTSGPTTPAGPPIGTATMRVESGTGSATIRYRINGGAEETVADATLPWEMKYPVYDQIESSFTAEGGDAALTCSITMDGKLVAFKTEPRPTCSFAYYS